MAIAAIILIALGAAVMVYAIYTYVGNTLPEPMDHMGQSIVFITWWYLGAIPCAVGIGLLPAVAWWWGLVAIGVLVLGSVFYQIMLDLFLLPMLGRTRDKWEPPSSDARTGV